MHAVIDTAQNIGPYASRLAAAGVRTVIRYYNNRNGPNHPTKCLTAEELAQLFAAGLSVAVVFEQRGGADDHIEDLTAATGKRDGRRALALATSLGQPEGSAIYFAVDWDFDRPAQLQQIAEYFAAARAELGGRHLVGSYGSGRVGGMLRAEGLIEHIWLSGSLGWSGTREALSRGDWSLFQKDLDLVSPVGRFDHDGNVVNPAQGSFGQFNASTVEETPRGAGAAALYRVTARSGLNLRAGPGDGFRAMDSLPLDTLVKGVAQAGEWTAIDREGDGARDGYVFSGFLEPVSGSLPLALGHPVRAIDVARAELALGVREVPRSGDNPRIVMYHATTRGGAAPDATAWCSSFVNYCVEQAGQVGTDSKAARSWHDQRWGRDVTAAPQEGDIVVWRRQGDGEDGGHVAFFLSADADAVRVLGGNQGNRVCEATYPRSGKVGSFQYTLLSIRR